MIKQFTNKVVLIAGGNSGTDKATALAFTESGAQVAIAGRRINVGEETVNLIEKAGGSSIFIPTDITQETEETIEKYIDRYPIKRLGTPEEIAQAVLWLCLAPAKFVIGHSLVLDGDLTIQH
ncbi:hypothetical protein B7486_57870 [cyanobacterium TDX16]|nr:hypothetical protein B7486_57870 [cyanobacterium TDX16]